jgi:hypothetical protein
LDENPCGSGTVFVTNIFSIALSSNSPCVIAATH